MDAAYFRAAIPEPCCVFGLRLLPFSLGRYRLLRRFESAFVCEAPIDISSKEDLERLMVELVFALLVCSMPVADFLEFIEGRRAGRDLRRWSKRIRKQIAKESDFNLLSKVGLFRSYIEESSRIPDYWEEQESPATSATHWSQNVEVALRSELGYSLEEIQEGPLSKALLDYFKHAENCGLIRLIAEGETQSGGENLKLLEKLWGKEALCPA